MPLLIAAALLGATPLSPVAQDAPPPPPRGARAPGRMLQRFDANGDGRIDRTEFAKQSADRFARTDTNGDGTIDATEMAAGRGGGRGMMRRDGDASGTLSRTEFDKQSADRFARIDTNGDGVIDAQEQAAMGNRMRGGRRGGVGTPPPPSPSVTPALTAKPTGA